MSDEPNAQPEQTPPQDAGPQDSAPQDPAPDDAAPQTPPQDASQPAAGSESAEAQPAAEASSEPQGTQDGAAEGGALEDEWAAALADQQGSSDPQAAADAIAEALASAGGSQPAAAPDPAASPAQAFEPPQVEPPPANGGFGSLEVLDDVELDLWVELGRTELYIEDVLKLGSGSVIQLDKAAGDPVDIYVNQRLVARGEVLVLNDNFCVRINEIVSPVPELDDPTQ